jgi:hypothetical protein
MWENTNMPWRTTCIGVIVCLAISLSPARSGRAGERPAAPVPPTLEIEVLDPGVDPLGNPAVIVRPCPDGQCAQVDIPPVVLVHRYYYTGDRSFQAQMLPGGPSIIVVNHPKTGERCYIEAQMLPGAPRVTYTSSCIEYDYGENGITVHFGLFGHPTIKYRSGLSWDKKVSNLVHAEHWKDQAHKVTAGCKAVASVSQTSLKAAVIDGTEVVKTATLPVQNILRMMPLGAAVFDPDHLKKWEEKVAEHERQHELEHATKVKERDELTLRTNR